jgi:hypothetical protein
MMNAKNNEKVMSYTTERGIICAMERRRRRRKKRVSK